MLHLHFKKLSPAWKAVSINKINCWRGISFIGSIFPWINVSKSRFFPLLHYPSASKKTENCDFYLPWKEDGIFLRHQYYPHCTPQPFKVFYLSHFLLLSEFKLLNLPYQGFTGFHQAYNINVSNRWNWI